MTETRKSQQRSIWLTVAMSSPLLILVSGGIIPLIWDYAAKLVDWSGPNLPMIVANWVVDSRLIFAVIFLAPIFTPIGAWHCLTTRGSAFVRIGFLVLSQVPVAFLYSSSGPFST